jgi:hypothetical protein
MEVSVLGRRDEDRRAMHVQLFNAKDSMVKALAMISLIRIDSRTRHSFNSDW